MGILTQHMYKAPVPIRALVPQPQDVPPGLEAIILKCLSKKPEQRYQSMEELAADLEQRRARQVPDAVPEMMARSGGFNVPADYFRNPRTSEAAAPMIPANPMGRSEAAFRSAWWSLALLLAIIGGGPRRAARFVRALVRPRPRARPLRLGVGCAQKSAEPLAREALWSSSRRPGRCDDRARRRQGGHASAADHGRSRSAPRNAWPFGSTSWVQDAEQVLDRARSTRRSAGRRSPRARLIEGRQALFAPERIGSSRADLAAGVLSDRRVGSLPQEVREEALKELMRGEGSASASTVWRAYRRRLSHAPTRRTDLSCDRHRRASGVRFTYASAGTGALSLARRSRVA